MLSDTAVRALAAFDGEGVPVTSCYLDVDGRVLPSHGDIERAFEQLRRRAGLSGSAASDVHPSVAKDLERMTRHVQGFARQNHTRGLALFSCSARGFWEVHELPVRLHSRLVVRPAAHVRPLEEVLDEYERFGVLLTDRQRARMFVFELGALVEHTERLDPLERHGDDDRGEMVKTRVDHQRDEQAQQHLRKAAQLAFDVFQRHSFDRLLVGAPTDVAGDLERLLHPYLRERLADRIHLSVAASDTEILRAAMEAEERVERRGEAALIEALRETPNRGVHGLAATIAALNAHRVETLLVSASFDAEGWRCSPCQRLALLGRRCEVCGQEMTHVADLAEEAIEVAWAQQARVESLVGNADLDVLGGIGALLRY